MSKTLRECQKIQPVIPLAAVPATLISPVSVPSLPRSGPCSGPGSRSRSRFSSVPVSLAPFIVVSPFLSAFVSAAATSVVVSAKIDKSRRKNAEEISAQDEKSKEVIF